MTLQDQGLWTAPRRVPAGVPVDQLAAIEALRTRACRRLVEAAGGDASALGEYLTRSRVLRGRLAATLWPAGTADASEDLLREMRRLEAAARALGGRSAHLRLRPLPDQVFSIDALLEACDAFERMAAKRRVAGDRYSAKMLGSILLLVPSLLAAAMGRPMEKGESFAWLKREATPDLRNAVVTIERWRAEWKHALAPPLPQGMVTQRVLRTINRLPSVELMRRSGVLHEAGRCLFRGAWAMLAELERATR